VGCVFFIRDWVFNPRSLGLGWMKKWGVKPPFLTTSMLKA
jgi:hypothetical protein